MEWIPENSHPQVSGKYLVEARSMMGNINRLVCYWNGKSWSISNQMVLKWLKEN